ELIASNGICMVLVFFFQAEDGIRDFHVTGVQTCALPILLARIRKNALFQKMLAGNALQRKPPLTMFRNFRYLNDEKKHSLDLKRQGLAPFVESVRVFALAHGVETANTLERIDALARKDVFDA